MAFCGVHDRLDATVGIERAEADVDSVNTFRQDHILAAAARISINIKTGKGIGLPVGMIGISATDEIGVATLAAVQQVVTKATIQHISALTPKQGVIPPAAIEKIRAPLAVDPIISAIGQHLLRFPIANKGIAAPGADTEPAARKKIVQPA